MTADSGRAVSTGWGACLRSRNVRWKECRHGSAVDQAGGSAGGAGCAVQEAAGRAEREKRLEDLAVRVLVAVGERDAAVVDAERRAGQALREMTEDEGLSVPGGDLTECGDRILREAVWLHVASSRTTERMGLKVTKNSMPDSMPGAAERLARGSRSPRTHEARPRRDQAAGSVSAPTPGSAAGLAAIGVSAGRPGGSGRYAALVVAVPGGDCRWWSGAISRAGPRETGIF